MKNILSIFILVTLVAFSACEPMEDIYNEIDKNEAPVSADVEFTFTADDYAAASTYALEIATTEEDIASAESIEDLEAFNKEFSAEQFVPYVIADTYGLLKDGSVATVTYKNYVGGLDYLENFGTATAYELETADYDAMGEGSYEPGQYNNFSSSVPPEDYLPDFLLGKYPSAVADDMVAITYAFYSGSVTDLTDYYSFDGSSWSVVSGSYVLSSDDYDSMGSPGNYNNFSGSDAPENYLPVFLKLKFPYAAAGDIKVPIYKYYAGGGVTETRADEYHFDGSTWTEYDAIVVTTNQFIHNGDGWVFDPTETHSMVSADFQTIVDYVEANIGAEYIDSYGTQDFYYGAGSYYSNFDLRAGKWDSDVFDSWEEAVAQAIGDVLLPSLYPNATLQINGVDMYYKVVFDTYSGADATYSMKFQVTKAGPSPEFSYVEGSLTSL